MVGDPSETLQFLSIVVPMNFWALESKLNRRILEYEFPFPFSFLFSFSSPLVPHIIYFILFSSK
jgi:hypothetical protein